MSFPAGSRVVSWFSCGAASARATVLAQRAAVADKVPFIAVRITIPNEHADNDRFTQDCIAAYGLDIKTIASDRYASCWEVWERRRYLAGPKGALCTTEMKKIPRFDFEAVWNPTHQVFGFTAEETHRAKRFVDQNPDVRLVTPLIETGLSKADCLAALVADGIDLPVMYKLGYTNNNCIGCVKGGAGYWNKIRVDFPDVFNRMAKLERELGAALCRVGNPQGRIRVPLDELSEDIGKNRPIKGFECSLLCG